MPDHDELDFFPFDPMAEVERTDRNLPHWFQSGVAIFVTFRTIDSMPKEVLLRMQAELKDWIERQRLPAHVFDSFLSSIQNDDRHRFESLPFNVKREVSRYYNRLFMQSLDDCHGACELKNQQVAKVVSDALLCHNGSRYDLDSFVIMPNHVHAIVQFREGFNLAHIGQSWLRFTARKINPILIRKGAFWQPEPFDHLIRSPAQFSYYQNYIEFNPKKAKLRCNEFVYWSR
jgi:REP element-mobilizing transposase RayT